MANKLTAMDDFG